MRRNQRLAQAGWSELRRRMIHLNHPESMASGLPFRRDACTRQPSATLRLTPASAPGFAPRGSAVRYTHGRAVTR